MMINCIKGNDYGMLWIHIKVVVSVSIGKAYMCWMTKAQRIAFCEKKIAQYEQ